MVYLILVMIILSIRDIRNLISKNRKKDLYIYIIMMLLVGAFSIFYYSNPARDSFSKILLSLINSLIQIKLAKQGKVVNRNPHTFDIVPVPAPSLNPKRLEQPFIN